jgi:hypothetical protein
MQSLVNFEPLRKWGLPHLVLIFNERSSKKIEAL